jgi:hypothetical protein
MISIYFHQQIKSINFKQQIKSINSSNKSNRSDILYLKYVYLQKLSNCKSTLTGRTAEFIHHLSTTHHHSYLVNIHQFLLDLPTAPHLSLFLQISRPLYLKWIQLRFSNCIRTHCTLHPNRHRLKTNQLPIRQALHPSHKSVIYFYFWCLNRIRRLQIYSKPRSKELQYRIS